LKTITINEHYISTAISLLLYFLFIIIIVANQYIYIPRLEKLSLDYIYQCQIRFWKLLKALTFESQDRFCVLVMPLANIITFSCGEKKESLQV